ncbi:MAG: hypothetical protein K6G90_00635 [Clostridia bacterium]|nr:hypothetical protein [Clostridia bacterium]
MKFVKRFFSIIFSAVLIYAAGLGVYYYLTLREIRSVPQEGLDAQQIFTPGSENVIPLSTFYYNMLSDNAKVAYVRLLNGYHNAEEGIKVPPVTSEEFSDVIEALRNDNPDRPAFGCHWYLTHNSFYDTIIPSEDVTDKIALEMPLRQKMIGILTDLPDGDDYEKELYIHDYIVNHCTYKQTDESNNAYGVLWEAEAVCTGYARAMQLLLCSIGIPTTVISGDACDDDGNWEAHMWNYILLDGEYYFVDPTWDDPRSDRQENTICHRYFNVNSHILNIDHKNYDTTVFSTSAEADNYFVRSGSVFDFYNSDTIREAAQHFIKNPETDEMFLEICFSNDTAFQDAEEGFFESDGDDLRMLIHEAGLSTDSVYHTSSEEHRYIRISF